MIESSLWATAVKLYGHLKDSGYPFCFIGGLVVQRWGQPRMTGDVDATILCEFGDESRLAQTFLDLYESRIEDPLAFATQARILLLRDTNQNRIDLSIGGIDFEHRVIARSSMWGVPCDQSIRTCGAEDLVVLKAFADRDQDWIDIKNVLIRQGSHLDRDLIREELKPLIELKEQPEILDRLESLFQATRK
ncbi:MAG: nucleotidyltransferase [Planctomycetota bacterium]